MKNKLFASIALVIAIFMAGACSSSQSYDSAKSKALIEKIQNHEELSDADCSAMIDQLSAAHDALESLTAQAGDDKEKDKEIKKSPEFKELTEVIIYFGIELDSRKDDLSNSNKKKLNKVLQKFNASKAEK